MTGSQADIRIIVADDHAVVRQGLATIVKNHPGFALLGEAKDGNEAVALWSQHRPDLGLFDLRMPNMDAVAAIEAIRLVEPEARIIILTTYDGDEDIFRALRAGAKGYMLKDATLEQITACIEAVHAGRAYIPPPIAEKLAHRVSFDTLSERERTVLNNMAQGLANKEIAIEMDIALATVKFHVNNLMSKLGVSSRTEAIAIAAKRGLIRLD
jgi:two-component system, NarL family, response regulator